MEVMLYSPEPAEEYDLEVVYSQNMPNGMFFANEGLSAISHLKLSSSGIAGHASGISICPNPTNDIVWITSVKGFDEIAIINSSVSFFYTHVTFSNPTGVVPEALLWRKVSPPAFKRPKDLETS